MRNVRVLTGGLVAWEANRNEIALGPGNLPQPGTIAVSEGNMPVANLDSIHTRPKRGILMGVHKPNYFEGRSEYADLQAGHIPSAVNLAAHSLQNVDGSFLPVEQPRGRLASIGIEDSRNVAVYSGSGLHSSLFVQAMVEADAISASLYVGGWSQWAGDLDRSIVRF